MLCLLKWVFKILHVDYWKLLLIQLQIECVLVGFHNKWKLSLQGIEAFKRIHYV